MVISCCIKSLLSERVLSEVLKKYNMSEANATPTPMEPGQLKGDSNDPLDESYPYREIIGALNYAATQTRPDIAFTVGWLGRKVTKPTKMDWNILIRCLKYLKGTLDYGLCYSSNDSLLIAYSDADYAGDLASYKSTTGQLIIHGGAPIAWRSKLQGLVVTSTTEAEYVAMSSTIKTVVYLKSIRIELGLLQNTPTPLNCDNRGAVLIATNDSSSQRTRHLGAQLAYTKQEHQKGTVNVRHVPADQQLADILTKPLTKEKFIKNRDKLLRSTTILTTMIYILMLLPLILANDYVTRTDYVTWLKTPNYIEIGKKLVRIRVRQVNRCSEYTRGIDSLSRSSIIGEPLKDALKLCEHLRKEKYLTKIEELKGFKFPLEGEGTLGRTRRSANQSDEEDDDAGPVKPASFWLTSIVPGYHSIYEYHNNNSAYNTVWKHHKQLKDMRRVIKAHSERFQHAESINSKTISSINKLKDQVNETNTKVEEILHSFPQLMQAISQINIQIQRDSDLIEDIRNGFVNGQLNVYAVRKIYPSSAKIIEHIAPEMTRMVDFSVKNDIMNFIMQVPRRDLTTSIYKAEVFKEWLDLNTFKLYTGPQYIMYNNSNNCSKFIDEPMTLGLHTACSTGNSTVDINPSFKTVFVTDQNRVEETAPKMVLTHTYKLIQCYQNSIIIQNKTRACEKWPFTVPINISVGVRGYFHSFDDSEIIMEHEERLRFNFSNFTSSAPWAKHLDSIAEDMATASVHNSLMRQLGLINLESYATDHPKIVAGAVAGVPTLALSFIILAYMSYRCRKDPISAALEKQVLCNLAGICHSEPALYHPSAPSININIGDTKTLSFSNGPDQDKRLRFDKLYPELVSTGNSVRSQRPPTPFTRLAQSCLSLADSISQRSMKSICSSGTTVTGMTTKDGLRNLEQKPNRFPKPDQISTRSLPAMMNSSILARPPSSQDGNPPHKIDNSTTQGANPPSAKTPPPPLPKTPPPIRRPIAPRPKTPVSQCIPTDKK